MAKVVFFSGAGISADSGISTFRDSDGLWEKHKVEEICMAGCLSWNKEATLNFYDLRRKDIEDKKPNLAHEMISELKNQYPDKVAIITQNVDDMFERAGCKEVLHLHGFLQEIRCQRCDFVKNIGYEKQNREEKCPTCKGELRPNIVFFGEAAPMYEKLYEELEDCEVFVCIGTSGAVINVDMLAQWGEYKILNNLEASELIHEELFDVVLYERASEAIKKIIPLVQNRLKD
ncbi:MAG TPA: NAD-dependent deacetylase [Sulfurospirillum sp. UBA11407]|nr:MAG TPA: NAD-dependent deacetylase [Sulfurospirillum sp. UBA11407]